MIDHVLGRPSTTTRKYQVILVVLLWSIYTYRGDRNGPQPVRRISELLSKKLTTWQTVVITFLAIYAGRNLDALVGLESPEPLANLYSPSFFRATWVTTALDAGYWSVMRVRNRPMREVLSLIFSLYYLIAAERADAKVRQIRSALTVDHLRVSWNKGSTGILGAVSSLMRPKLMSYPPRSIRIPRPAGSRYSKPVEAWLYFDGPLTALAHQTRVVFDVPGGGFVAMSPRSYDDKLLAWAGRLGLPVLSIDYGKAPEFPYPYAIHECFDAYRFLIETRGRCIGLSGRVVPRLVVTGDSAGGNIAVSTVLMVMLTNIELSADLEGTGLTLPHSVFSGMPRTVPPLPLPDGVVLIYPALNMNIANWMSEEQIRLIGDRQARKANRMVLRQKSDDYRRLALLKTAPTDEGIFSDSDAVGPRRSRDAPPPRPMRIATSSIISYFNDRVLTPEMMRSMILLYIGPPQDGRPAPAFQTDYLLSPVLAPHALLESFPPLRILTGERDPLVDDTIVFAARVREARRLRREREREQEIERRRQSDNAGLDQHPDESDHGEEEEEDEKKVQVSLIPDISHGFLNIVALFPDGWKYVYRCVEWIDDLLYARDLEILQEHSGQGRSHHHLYAAHSPGSHSGLSTPSQHPLLFNGAGYPRHYHGASRLSRNASHCSDSSSDTEDRPLEIPRRSSSTKKTSTGQLDRTDRPSDSSASSGLADRQPREAAGRAQPPESSNRRSGSSRPRPSLDPAATRRPVLERNVSIYSLPSQEDLLSRRMEGLTGTLLGPSADEVNRAPGAAKLAQNGAAPVVAPAARAVLAAAGSKDGSGSKDKKPVGTTIRLSGVLGSVMAGTSRPSGLREQQGPETASVDGAS